MARKRIGELLLEAGIVSRTQLEEGLTFHRSSGQRLGVSLTQLGFVTDNGSARLNRLDRWHSDCSTPDRR